jgi:hypothetical protein
MARTERASALYRLAAGFLAMSFLTGAMYMVKPETSDINKLSGTLFFHRYSEYGAWDAELLSLDLGTGALGQVNENWRSMISPINAHLSNDGQYMTFMGTQAGLTENEWDVFVSKWDGSQWSEPINLTGPNGKRDEDPKFSPNGTTIVYKENGVLATVKRAGGAKTYLSIGEAQSSMPYFRTNGQDILFERDGKIFLKTVSGDIEMDAGIAGISSYYPIGVDNERFLFTRVQDSKHDGIRWGYYDGRPSEDLFFNNDYWDSSDPYPYQNAKDFIFLVSGDHNIYFGGYNLVIADLRTKKVVNIDDLYGEINSDLQELGPAWTPFTYQE